MLLPQLPQLRVTLGACQELARGRGVETESGSDSGKGGVVKNGPLKGGGS